ncbi:hydrogen peroxide-inducible genes activator [Tenacibaculum finnmarkense]|uniref:LysR family transcriptional regulator n=1 Tax=Tenacibaculum finnmarkense genomovar finnmarkense TaxID=1458503 RepID=A0AAP1RH08_9FLAO|nr:hydrogen peroxide-inducible genes activator [Tenacibaculum finnmarkense]MBE7653398.1 LysR family transcriptional regulator [Tenacibaculum finnmarkense genomovar finnmarkense]MBE7695748.1 LysR family transcriptional regulator [Tenacibaculum finnmarkense genomovar finnmarkense]MCD8428426.1 LysR family transcriptional regulator [Tenacibaculum finnmarkense genomovar finnmarkense]MCD8440882.1 LysR family transcriptional regulator [Tenacibaculum finnmarkense genomovar ulcerans]MCG8721814.1 LysR f
MNIQQFQYVLAVVDSENFETAAEKCFITQSTLSTMIGRLEGEIGIKIFNRKTKPVSITTEGVKIIERFRIIDNEIGQLEDVIQELKGEMVGELKIGIIPTIAPYLLPLFLQKFAQKFPLVKIIVKEIPTAQIIKSLKNRSLDIGLLALPIADNELTEQELYVEPFLVYDCRAHKTLSKISINNLDYSKLWLLQEGHCLRTQVYQICELLNESSKCELNFEFESGSMDSLLRFTKSNKGMTIIPFLASIDFPSEDKKNILEFKTPIPSRSVGVLTHKFFVKKRLANELKKIIQDSVLELLPKIKEVEIIKPV